MSTGKRTASGKGAGTNPASTAPKAPVAPAAGAKTNPSQTQKEIDDATAAAIASQKNATAQTQEVAQIIDPNATSAAGADGKPSATVTPQAGTAKAPEQPAKTDGYIREFNRSVELFGVMPLDSFTEQELKDQNDAEVAKQRSVPVAPLSEAHQQEIVRAFGLFGVAAIALQTATFDELKATNDAKQKELDGAANVTQNTNQISNAAIKTNEAAMGGEFVADANHVIAEKNGEKKRFTKTTWALMQDAPDQWKLVPSTPPEVQNLQNK